MYLDNTLHLPVPNHSAGQAPVDLRPLVVAGLAAPVHSTLVCSGNCGQSSIPCVLVPQPGQVMILDLVRVGHHGTVSIKFLYR